MSNARGKNKARARRRAKKVSNGVHGARRHRLSMLEKILIRGKKK